MHAREGRVQARGVDVASTRHSANARRPLAALPPPPAAALVNPYSRLASRTPEITNIYMTSGKL